MGDLLLDQALIDAFLKDLVLKERSANTVMKYGRDLAGFSVWLDGRAVTKDLLLSYKHCLLDSGRAPSSVNSSLSAVNGFLAWAGRPDLKAGFLKIQRKAFLDASQELTREDYARLVDAAYGAGRTRLGLLLETLGSTGIRVSELRYVTAAAARDGRTDINLKGKIRTILIPSRLRLKLLAYARDAGIREGPVFRTRTGSLLSRQSVWRDMKQLALRAGIPASKVYPHNFRHMFASVFYGSCKDIVKLADVLGHSSVNTTRIYLIASEREHARQLDALDLVR